MRELCLHRTQPVVAGTRRNPEAKALLFELQALGNNLNQLTRHANTAGMLVELENLEDVINLLKAAITRVIGL